MSSWMPWLRPTQIETDDLLRSRAPRAMWIAGGWAADELFGDPARLHPVAGFGSAAARLESIVWRPTRLAGISYVAALAAFLAAGMALSHAITRRSATARSIFSLAVMWTVVGGRSLRREARRLAQALERGDLEEARLVARSLVGRNPSELDATELCRAALESVAENTADAVVAPLLWGAVAGPPGAVLYRASNTLDAMVGYRDDRYEQFGWAAARLDDVLTWPAARLSALLAIALAPCVGGDSRGGWEIWRRDGDAHPSPNAGQAEATFAGVLGVTLGGTNRYGDRVEQRPLMGTGGAPDTDDVLRACKLSGLIGAATAGLCFVVALRGRR